jgi:hypothetical protein
MIEERFRDVMLQEVASWHAEGLINDDQRDVLLHRYRHMQVGTEADARAAEMKFSTGMLALLWLGGGLVCLGVSFLLALIWTDIGPLWRFLIMGNLAIGAYVVSIRLHRTGVHPKTAAAIAVVGGLLAWVALACTFALFPTEHEPWWRDDLWEVMWDNRIAFWCILTVLYLVMSNILRSQAQGWLFTAALVIAATIIADEYSTGSDVAQVFFFFSVGTVLCLLGLFMARTKRSFLVAPLAVGGLMLSFCAMFIGTFLNEIELISYFMIFVVPALAIVVGARQQTYGLVYLGLVGVLTSLIRVFSEVFEETALVFLASIVLGIGLIVVAVRMEKRRAMRGSRTVPSPAVGPDAAGSEPAGLPAGDGSE